MITIRLTTSTAVLMAKFTTPGGDIDLDFQMCLYCEVEPVQLPAKFCCDAHRIRYWRLRIAECETPPVTRPTSILTEVPA